MDLRRRTMLATRRAGGDTPERKYGVFIQDTEGKLWLANEWDGTATPNGIAVRSAYSGPPDGVLVSIPQSTASKVKLAQSANYTMVGVDNDAKNEDYNGYENTKALAQTITNFPDLAIYTFPNGQQGYIGAYGEMLFVLKNIDEINKCLKVLGKKDYYEIFPDYMWTSTVYGGISNSLYLFSIMRNEGVFYSNTYIVTNTAYLWPIGKIAAQEGEYDEIFGNIPPESTSFEFPLYITVPYVNTSNRYRAYNKEPSVIVGQLWDWFVENADVEEGMYGNYYILNNPPFYINGKKVQQMNADEVFGLIDSIRIHFYLEGKVVECTIDSDFSIWILIENT